MLKAHERAALIPNEPGVNWHSFLRARFVEDGKGDTSLAILVGLIQQRDQTLADLSRLVELSVDSSLPVVSDFRGVLNLESREFSIQQAQPPKSCTGQFSANGRVMVLREAGQTKAVHLVHEETLALLV